MEKMIQLCIKAQYEIDSVDYLFKQINPLLDKYNNEELSIKFFPGFVCAPEVKDIITEYKYNENRLKVLPNVDLFPECSLIEKMEQINKWYEECKKKKIKRAIAIYGIISQNKKQLPLHIRILEHHAMTRIPSAIHCVYEITDNPMGGFDNSMTKFIL